MSEQLEETEAPKKKRKKTTSPTARTLAECRKRGWTAQVVERFNKFAGRRIDLFGVIDIVVIIDGRIAGIQATTGDHHAERIAKILEEPRAREWVAAGGLLAVWSWSKRGDAGTRKLWMLRTEVIDLARFPEVAAA